MITAVPQNRLADDVAYVLPMAAFMVFVWIGTTWKSLYPIAYVARSVIVAILLIALRRYYTKIRWRYWWLGAILGVVGIFQWVGMQLFLQRHFEHFKPSADVFDPTTAFHGFIIIRIIGAVLVVPVMEELFWRDFAWRTIIAPADFKLARIGEWDLKAFIIVPLIFATVHGNWWATAIVWGFMIGALLVYTRSLGACIVMHATTNLLLAGYVLWTRDWSLW